MRKSTAIKLFVMILSIAFLSLAIYGVTMPVTYSIKESEFNSIYNNINALNVTQAENYTLNYQTVTVKGVIVALAGYELRGTGHEKFIISDGKKNLMVVYNIDFLGRGFLKPEIGDKVILTGELILGKDTYKNITIIGIIHKVAEGTFLLLYRHNKGLVTEVGFFGIDDEAIIIATVIFIVVFNGYVWYLSKKKGWDKVDLSQRRRERRKTWKQAKS